VDRLLDRYPHAAVLVDGSGQDTAALTAALARGARGLMLWSPHPGRTTAACSTSPVAAGGPADRDPWPTERELQILRGISRGQTYAAIGRDLLLCEDTIKALSRQLFGKLGARDRPHAVALGIRTGVLDAPRGHHRHRRRSPLPRPRPARHRARVNHPHLGLPPGLSPGDPNPGAPGPSPPVMDAARAENLTRTTQLRSRPRGSRWAADRRPPFGTQAWAAPTPHHGSYDLWYPIAVRSPRSQ